MIDLIVTSAGALYSSTNLLAKKSVRNAKSIVLDKEIDISNCPANLRTLLEIPKNYKVLRQFHYEVLAIKAFFIFCMLCSIYVLLGALIIIFNIDLKSSISNLPEFINRGVYVAFVLSLIFSFACTFLAGNLSEDSNK